VLTGNHEEDLSVDGLVTYIKSLQTDLCVAASPVRLHDPVDLAFELRDREDTKDFYVELLKKREKTFRTDPMPQDRTKYPMAVFSGMTGLGKTRMLEEWEQMFKEAHVPEPYLGVLVSYGNGYSVKALDGALPVEAGFSWRMLHRLFLEDNCAFEYNAWNSTSFIPHNAHNLTIRVALQVVRALAGECRKSKSAGECTVAQAGQTLSLFIGIDEYQKIPEGKDYKERVDRAEKPLSTSDIKELRPYTYLWKLVEALQDNCKLTDLHIHPALAGTRWGPLSIAGSSVPDAVRAPLRLLSPKQMEDVVASNETLKNKLTSKDFRRKLFFFGGIPRPSLEFARGDKWEEVWKHRIEAKWNNDLTSLELLLLVAVAVSGKTVLPADPSDIMSLKWGALADQGLCLIRDDKQVSIPYCVFRLASTLSDDGLTLPYKCLLQNLKYLRDNIDAVLFDNALWKQWEKFGACFFAMRINALLILGMSEVPFHRLYQHAKTNGCNQMVDLQPMEVCEINETLSVELPDIVLESDTSKRLMWASGGKSGIRYCLLNGEGGEGVDVFSSLRLAGSTNVLFYADQRKRMAKPLGLRLANCLIKKEAIVPTCLGKDTEYVLGLFSLLPTFKGEPDKLHNNSFVVSYGELDAFYGCLSSHPACSPAIDVNFSNVTTLRLLSSVAAIVPAIDTHRRTRKFADMDAFKKFCQEKGCSLSTDDELRCLAFFHNEEEQVNG
jgi:hypothetical protein